MIIPQRYGHWYEKNLNIYKDSAVKDSYILHFIEKLKESNIKFKLVVPEKVKSNIDVITYEDLLRKNDF